MLHLPKIDFFWLLSSDVRGPVGIFKRHRRRPNFFANLSQFFGAITDSIFFIHFTGLSVEDVT